MIMNIEVSGYRLLSDFKADLKPLTVVIGANASGKSSLIDCLRLIRECCDFPIETALSWHRGAQSMLTAGNSTDRLSWKIDFCRPRTPRWNDLPLQNDNPLKYEVVLKVNVDGQMQPEYEVLRNLNPYTGHDESLKFLEATQYRRQVFDREKHRLIPFDVAQPEPSAVQESSSAEKNQERGIAAQQEMALLLSQIRFFNEFPIPAVARFLLAGMAFYPGFDVTWSSALRSKPADIKRDTMLTSVGDNLGTVLHEILTRYDYRSTAEDLHEYLRVSYPTFEDIHCETTYGTPPQALVGIREKGISRSMYLWELSDGMLRFLCLATALLNPVPPPLIAIDEPELGLHPGLLPIVAEMIKSAAERAQVLVTTHSPDLLDCFGILV